MSHPHFPIEAINDEIDYWLQREAGAQSEVQHCHEQLDRLLGEKTLHLVVDDTLAEVVPIDQLTRKRG